MISRDFYNIVATSDRTTFHLTVRGIIALSPFAVVVSFDALKSVFFFHRQLYETKRRIIKQWYLHAFCASPKENSAYASLEKKKKAVFYLPDEVNRALNLECLF